MRAIIFPRYRLGWCSVVLCIASIIFFALFTVLLGSGPNYNMALAYTMQFVLIVISVTSVITGLISIIKRKELAFLVFIAVAISLLSLLGGMVAVVTSLLGLQK